MEILNYVFSDTDEYTQPFLLFPCVFSLLVYPEKYLLLTLGHKGKAIA